MTERKKDGSTSYLGFLGIKKAYDRMRRISVGENVGKEKTYVLLYADDIVIMSESDEFQSSLNNVDGYGRLG